MPQHHVNARKHQLLTAPFFFFFFHHGADETGRTDHCVHIQFVVLHFLKTGKLFSSVRFHTRQLDGSFPIYF